MNEERLFRRLPSPGFATECDHTTFGDASTIEQCIDKTASSWRRHCTICGGGFANHMSRGHHRQHDKTDACNEDSNKGH